MENRFQSLPFKCNLQRYSVGVRDAGAVAERRDVARCGRRRRPRGAGDDRAGRGGALHVESS